MAKTPSDLTGQGAPEQRLRALMLRSLEGERRAYAELLEELSGYLRAYFGRRLGAGAADAEDLVQEVLLALHLKRHTYDRRLPFTPWVYGIARYKLLDHLRRRLHRVPLAEAPEVLYDAADEDAAAARADLDKLLTRLPDRQRTLIEDVKLTGLSVAQAARRRGVTAGSARVMLHRSLVWLSKMVRDENG
jgi:RNA polymerase sigma-70 factor (ECF subfamily)